jgi:hypothetical protein
LRFRRDGARSRTELLRGGDDLAGSTMRDATSKPARAT